ncbi:protein FAM151B isoform X2 [Adelges cooleyi]|uniref:protein FAM151B isoform X2 n=1 Tax=Adelges cooleyi TaxID=133065 RepID=UPI0021801198|nr:protein FAM151B isoform X2 [Adelges cooleyi]
MNFIVYLDLILGGLLESFNINMDSASNNKMDLTTVTWDHAVNSKDKMQQAMTSNAMMIEADVVAGHIMDGEDMVVDENQEKIAIMGHPPNVVSDLSLQEFLHDWNRTTKGLKLDFKSTDAFLLALPVMENMFKDLPQGRTPWLNADILPGPGPGGNPGVDADIFLRASVKNFPNSMLSLGWTTKRNDFGAYSESYINSMVDVLFKNKYMKPVTYAVRASFAVNSIAELQYLLETSPVGSTLTVWCSDSKDVVDHVKLVNLVRTIGPKKVYLDLPDVMSRAYLDMEATTSAAAGSDSCVTTLNTLMLASTTMLMKTLFL